MNKGLDRASHRKMMKTATVLYRKTLTITCPQGSINQQDATIHTPPRTVHLTH